MSDQRHWASQRERGSFILMKFTAWLARVLGRRLISPLLYVIVLYFYLFGAKARRSIRHYQSNLAAWSGHAELKPTRLSVFRQFMSFADTLLDKLNADEVEAVLARVPLQLLQFHGDEEESDCARYGRPWIKAARMRPGVDLLEFSTFHRRASGILVDAFVEGYGGGGKTFDWSLIPDGFARPLVLSGGLDTDNVAEAVRRVRPWAVDVSSGVESAKGIKDAAKIAAFIAGVRHADG